MLKVISGESSHPASQVFGQEFLQVFFKVTPWAFVLIPCGFINQSNNPDAGKTANQDHCAFGNVFLCVVKNASGISIKKHAAYLGQQFSPIPKSTTATTPTKCLKFDLA